MFSLRLIPFIGPGEFNLSMCGKIYVTKFAILKTFIYIWLCWVFTAAQASLGAETGGYSSLRSSGVTAVASLAAEHRL